MALAASAIGTSIEWYGFFLYGTAAALYVALAAAVSLFALTQLPERSQQDLDVAERPVRVARVGVGAE